LFNWKDLLSIPLHLFIFLSFSSIASLPVEPDPPDGKALLFPEDNPKSVPFPNLLPLALLLLVLCFPVNFEIICGVGKKICWWKKFGSLLMSWWYAWSAFSVRFPLSATKMVMIYVMCVDDMSWWYSDVM